MTGEEGKGRETDGLGRQDRRRGGFEGEGWGGREVIRVVMVFLILKILIALLMSDRLLFLETDR